MEALDESRNRLCMPSVVSDSRVMWVYAPEPETSSPPPLPQRTLVLSLRWVPGVRYASVPMIGLIPASVAVFQKSYAPKTLPWSVTATAGIPCSTAAAISGLTLAAPSSMEYSLCTCRCTKESLLEGTALRLAEVEPG